jgi:hypothetical protein
VHLLGDEWREWTRLRETKHWEVLEGHSHTAQLARQGEEEEEEEEEEE